MKARKLKGKAMSLLTHLRNFGFIVIEFFVENPSLAEEKVFSMILQLNNIVLKIMSSEIREYEVVVSH